MLNSTAEVVRYSLTALVLILAAQACLGQSETESFLFDQTENGYCSEDLVSRTDTFLHEVSKRPSAKGVIIFQGKHDDEGRNLTYFRILESHSKQRGFDLDRISFVRAANGDKMVMYYWIVPHGAKEPRPNVPFQTEPIKSTVRFETAWADWHKWNDTEWTIYSYSFAD